MTMKKKSKKAPTPRLHVRSGDVVKVITGSSKGVVGKITSVELRKERVYVEGAATSKKAVRPSQEHPQGGWIDVPRPIHVSNVKKVEGAEPLKPVKKQATKKAAKKKA
jgi:large subunit ribosomal protein L24